VRSDERPSRCLDSAAGRARSPAMKGMCFLVRGPSPGLSEARAKSRKGEGRLIRLNNNVKTPGSAELIPLSQYACDVLRAWKKEGASKSEHVIPSLVLPNRPISTVKTAWKTTLKRAGLPAFPIYNLRHVFCTRLSEAAPDAVVQRAMRHTSPETKRHYQLGMADQVRNAVDKANKRLY
jgi:integrase